MKKRVGILGGSFDPVHKGHIKIASSFLKSGLIDELLVVLTPDPPHKKKQEQTAYVHRLAMLKLAFEGMNNVVISDVEQQLPKPSYTLQTICFLQETNSDTLYYLCLGLDSLTQFNQWHHYSDILEKVNLLVAERLGFDTSRIDPEILEHVVFIEHEPYPVSSTRIREKNGKGKVNEELPDAVAAYIEKNNLYT